MEQAGQEEWQEWEEGGQGEEQPSNVLAPGRRGDCHAGHGHGAGGDGHGHAGGDCHGHAGDDNAGLKLITHRNDGGVEAVDLEGGVGGGGNRGVGGPAQCSGQESLGWNISNL